MSNIVTLTDSTHYLIVTAQEVWDGDRGLNTVKFQVCALPYGDNEVVFDANEETGEQNYLDDFQQANRVATYLTNAMRTRRYIEDYLGLVTNSRTDLFNTGCIERIIEGDAVKFRFNKAVLARNVKDEMVRNGYERAEFHLATAVRVLRENTDRILAMI